MANSASIIIAQSSNSSKGFFRKFSEPKLIIALIVVLLIIVLVVVGYLYYPNQDKQEDTLNLAAEVNGEPILKEDYQGLLESQEYFYTNVYPKETNQKVSDEFIEGLQDQAVDSLIQEKLLTQYLLEKGIEVTDEEVDTFIQKEIVDKLYDGNRQTYEKELEEKYNSNLNNIKRTIRRDLLIQKVLAEEKIKPADFDKWYADFKAKAGIKIYVDLEGS